MRPETGQESGGKNDRRPTQVRVYVTGNGGRYVKANELMESAAADEAMKAIKAMAERDRKRRRD